jgi:hypothetical protein
MMDTAVVVSLCTVDGSTAFVLTWLNPMRTRQCSEAMCRGQLRPLQGWNKTGYVCTELSSFRVLSP